MTELINGRFVLVEEDGRAGGAAEVRKAFDTKAGDIVAVKLLRTDEHNETVKTFFEREIQTLQRLSHPHIIQMLDAGWDSQSGRYYLALDWVDRNFADLLREEGPFPWQDFFSRIGMPIISALAYAHLREVEHRDLKPSNILLKSDGSPKLADFGIAKIRDKVHSPRDSHTVASYRSGLYAPPELDESVPYIRDVFSFGVLAIAAMSASSPKDYPDLVPALDTLQLPSEVYKVLRRCVANPPDRPENAAVLEALLQGALGQANARAARHSNVLWLKMKVGSARNLLSLPEGARADFSRAEAAALKDLSDEVFAEYSIDRQTGLPDRNSIILLGRQFRFRLVMDKDERDRFAIVAAHKPSGNFRERARQRACPVGSRVRFMFTSRRPDGAALGVDALYHALEDHLVAADAVRAEDELGDLFASWRRLLEAREELARGEQQPLEFHGRHGRGKQVTFLLPRSTDQSLVGQEWEVIDTWANRTVGRGDVVAQEPDTVTIQFRHELKDLPARGRLVPRLGPTKIALTRQNDALIRVSACESTNPTLRNIIERPESLSPGEPAEITSWVRQDLDESKKEVVRRALGSGDLLLVEGPPGTGKTTVIAEIVAQVLRRSPSARILIVSQTHIAIDNALQRLEEAGIPDLVRLGLPDDPRVASSVQHLVVERQMKRWVAGIRARAQRSIAALAGEHGLEERHLRGAVCLQELGTTLGDIAHVERRIANLSEQRTGASPITGSEPADDVVDARARLQDLLEERDRLLEEARGHLASDLTIGPEPSQDEIRHAVEAVIGNSVQGRRLMELLALQAEWLHRVDSDKDMTKAFLNTRTVVAGTAIGFLGNPAVRNLEFDLCIFDEASKATATETLVPMSRARRWILVGDTRQLPPIDEDLLRDKRIMDEFQLTEKLVTTTLFQHFAHGLPDTAKHLLREQYRMIKPIGELISACFYQDQLSSPKTAPLPGYSRLGKPVLWINTEPFGNRRREQGGGGSDTSYSNRVEAQLAVDRLQAIDRAVGHGLIKPPGDRQLEVLLIAPYSRQVEELKHKIAGLSLSHVSAAALSVDAVQGRECDLAIFSVTRSNDRAKLGFLGPEYWRRINVALSRARFGLTIIGDAGFCRSSSGALQDVFMYMKTHKDDCEIRDADRS